MQSSTEAPTWRLLCFLFLWNGQVPTNAAGGWLILLNPHNKGGQFAPFGRRMRLQRARCHRR
jgi:hypothetical protein